MATNMENRNIQQALSRYNMRNNDYEEPNIFRYGRTPIVRSDKTDVMNNRALERKIGGRMCGGRMCGCAMCGGGMCGGQINNVLSEMDERFDARTNKNFSSPYKEQKKYIQSGQTNFVPYYNMLEMAQLNSRSDADNVLRGRGIDYTKYANQAKNIGEKYVRENKDKITSGIRSGVKDLMNNADVKKLAQQAMNEPSVVRAVSTILESAEKIKSGGSIMSVLGKAGATAVSVGSKVGTAGLKYGAVAVEVGAKYGAKGVAVATAVASNPAVQKVAQSVIDNPQVQEAVVGLIAQQVAKLSPSKPPETDPDEVGGGFRGKRGKRGGMLKIKEALKELKSKIKGKPTTTQLTLAEYEDDDDTFREDDDDDFEEAKKKVKGARKPDLEMRDLRSGGRMKDGRNKRALIVKKVMNEKGMKLIEASKYVKTHGLY